MKGVPVTVETEVKQGMGIHLVGLADQSVKESLLRVATAIQAFGYTLPGKSITINLAPADLRKTGAGYDLPIALGIISATQQEPLQDLDKYVIAGELGLDGSVRDIPGWMQAAELAKETGRGCILPVESAKLAARALGESVRIFGVDNIPEVIDILNEGNPEWTAYDDYVNDEDMHGFDDVKRDYWDSMKGHATEKRALEIAAAGGHPLLLVGPPGSGKSYLARALCEILPPMTEEESREVQEVYSAADKRLVPGIRPFRSPASWTQLKGLLGGGVGEVPLPGEVALAHNGVLYIDDFADVANGVKEAMRGPMEDGRVVITRLMNKVVYPTRFFPVFATKPCPCGKYGTGNCTCTVGQRMAHNAKLGGPIYDRLSMHVFVRPLSPNDVDGGVSSEEVQKRVIAAREIQMKRQGMLNDELTAHEFISLLNRSNRGDSYCEVLKFATDLVDRMDMSTRAYFRLFRIARTIADLEGSEEIKMAHVAEAASYRFLDKRIS